MELNPNASVGINNHVVRSFLYDFVPLIGTRCPVLELPDVVDILTINDTAGGNVTFFCPDGYSLNHTEALVCSITGQWEGDIPHCSSLFPLVCIPFLLSLFAVVECEAPEPHPHVTLSFSSLTYGSYATYTTEKGYKFANEANEVKLQCSEDKQWEGEFPDIDREAKLLSITANYGI